MKTGKLTLQPFSVVHSILYDETKGKASGVLVVDAQTKVTTEYRARMIFVNAACLNTNLLLLNSKSRRFPNGFGNDNGLLGRYIAFHNYRGTVTAYSTAIPTGIIMAVGPLWYSCPISATSIAMRAWVSGGGI